MYPIPAVEVMELGARSVAAQCRAAAFHAAVAPIEQNNILRSICRLLG